MIKSKVTCQNGVVTGMDYINSYLKNCEGSFNVEVKPYKKSRTTSQNSYYWAVIEQCRLFFRECGHQWTKEYVHNIMQRQFLTTVDVVNNVPIESLRSTTELNTEEMNDYIECIREYMHDTFDVLIEEPHGDND